jgi:hypothetical protein
LADESIQVELKACLEANSLTGPRHTSRPENASCGTDSCPCGTATRHNQPRRTCEPQLRFRSSSSPDGLKRIPAPRLNLALRLPLQFRASIFRIATRWQISHLPRFRPNAIEEPASRDSERLALRACFLSRHAGWRIAADSPLAVGGFKLLSRASRLSRECKSSRHRLSIRLRTGHGATSGTN